MKHLLTLLALALTTLTASAQHGLLGNLWVSTDHTNNPAFVTNLNAMVDCSRHQYINVEFIIGVTNASAGTMSVVWATGNTSTSIGDPNNQNSGCWGWFSVPLTNGGTVINWNTNIDVGRAKYWSIQYITNMAVQHVTNASVKAYIKRL